MEFHFHMKKKCPYGPKLQVTKPSSFFGLLNWVNITRRDKSGSTSSYSYPCCCLQQLSSTSKCPMRLCELTQELGHWFFSQNIWLPFWSSLHSQITCRCSNNSFLSLLKMPKLRQVKQQFQCSPCRLGSCTFFFLYASTVIKMNQWLSGKVLFKCCSRHGFESKLCRTSTRAEGVTTFHCCSSVCKLCLLLIQIYPRDSSHWQAFAQWMGTAMMAVPSEAAVLSGYNWNLNMSAAPRARPLILQSKPLIAFGSALWRLKGVMTRWPTGVWAWTQTWTLQPDPQIVLL